MEFEKLTQCEELVMKIIWDTDEELSLMEVVVRVNDKFHKDWKPQTVSTFLARLVRKGYLRHYRHGRVFFYQILVPLDVYQAQLANEHIVFWHHNNADEFLCALTRERPLRQEEIERIRKLLEEHE